MAALVGLWSCLLRPELSERLRPRERGYAVSIATSLRQARLIVQAARSIVEGSPLLAEMVESVTEDAIEFTTGMTFTAFPCSSRGARGWPIHTLAMDEAAHFVGETEGPAVADRVFEALAPSTAQFGDMARILVLSTPYGEDGFFAKLYEQAQSGGLVDGVAQHAATVDVNPMVDGDFLAREEARDPDGFRGEYGAEFVSSGSAFLDLERVVVADRGVLPREACARWFAGLDPAFSSDPFGLAIVGHDVSSEPPGLRLGFANAYLPLKGVGSFDDRLEEIIAVLRSFGVTLCATDQFASAAVIDRLAKAGITARLVSMNAASKTLAYTGLRGALYTGGLELYEHPGLLAELRRLRTRFSAGQAGVVNPRVGRSHGDMAQALALAAQIAGQAGSGGKVVTLGGLGWVALQGSTVVGRGSDGGVRRTGDLVLFGEKYIDKEPPGSVDTAWIR